MKIKAFFASFAIVAATSTAAFATPAKSFQPRECGTVSKPVTVAQWRWNDWQDRHDGHDRHDRHDRRLKVNNTKVYPRASEYIGPIGTVGRGRNMAAISEPTRIDNGREDFIVRQEGFNTIELRAVAGSSFVRQVTLEFMDGSAQILNPQQYLDRSNPTITLDVQGRNRAVKRILVYGTTARNSAYQVFAT